MGKNKMKNPIHDEYANRITVQRAGINEEKTKPPIVKLAA